MKGYVNERTWFTRVSHNEMWTEDFRLVLVRLHLHDRPSGGCICCYQHITFPRQREWAFHYTKVVLIWSEMKRRVVGNGMTWTWRRGTLRVLGIDASETRHPRETIVVNTYAVDQPTTMALSSNVILISFTSCSSSLGSLEIIMKQNSVTILNHFL